MFFKLSLHFIVVAETIAQSLHQQTYSSILRLDDLVTMVFSDVVVMQLSLSGQKWKRTLGKIAEWVVHACVVVLVVYAVIYTLSCVCACCIGLDLLAEIWRTLGGWQAFNYFVHIEQAVVESDSTDPES